MPRPPPLTADEVARERKMLRELKAMRKNELALSTLSKKRTRVPKIDDDNPFCTDRQLQDDIALAAFNKNPQLNAKRTPFTTPRTAQNPHNHTDIRVPPQRQPHVFHDANSSHVAVSFPAYHASISIAKPYAASTRRSSPPTQHEAVKKPITFGHRPTSASRHFNPVTSELNASAAFAKKKPLRQTGGIAIGMSAESLKGLLHQSVVARSKTESDESPNANRMQSPGQGRSCLNEAGNDAIAALEKGFDTRQYMAPKLKKESILNTPTDASVGEILAKYRKLAVGLS
ncbi:hypothetical protein H310_05246 [Aphanomyces invadans]|uniref:Uncharacterized protein n=1 Tax=Aphanomyces invadans TaxID=157072 RepID=A0A024UA32_9STRA|nr:hypothetical protein H310_05246 [Aphanomyces invadans]ETW02747.1 hypothetical protein H310_05246 [Aphanomyces invadans]|eukprot:XP_008868131.1 hypothetical protein H310_05246 [Aphanomyces invadans]